MIKTYITSKYKGVKTFFESYKAPKTDHVARQRATLGLSTLGAGLSWVMTTSTYAMTIPLFYNLFIDLGDVLCWCLTIIASILVSVIIDRTLTMTAPYTATQIIKKEWSFGLFCLACVNFGQMSASFCFSWNGMELALKTVTEHQHKELDEDKLQKDLDLKVKEVKNDYTILLADARRDDSSRVEKAKAEGHAIIINEKRKNKTHNRTAGRQQTYLKNAVMDSTTLVQKAIEERTYKDVYSDMESAILGVEMNHKEYLINRRSQHNKKEERISNKINQISRIILWSLAFSSLSYFFIQLLLADLRQGKSPNNKQLQKITKKKDDKVTKSYVTKNTVTSAKVESPVIDRIRQDEAGKALIKRIQQYVNHLKDETRVNSSIRALHHLLPQCENFEKGSMEHVLNWLYEKYEDYAFYFDKLRK